MLNQACVYSKLCKNKKTTPITQVVKRARLAVM